MDKSEIGPWATEWAEEVKSVPVIQGCLQNPRAMGDIRKYADDMRVKFPDVTDADLGRALVWAADFISGSIARYGEQVTPGALVTTFAVTALELLQLEIGG